MNVLEVNNLGKVYRVFNSQWKRIFSWYGFPFKPIQQNWVLRNVDFSVLAGEAIGIVGQNGAGKSTLLKMITGAQQPSEGNVHVNGSISAILELGMGFNPELTGRQNASYGLGLMGFSPYEIEKVMPDVEGFANVDKYFDQPVRTYSSGMHVRVAFAVATAFRPDILIVDEALSVGDLAFQRKCFRLLELYLSEGMTLLYVSHDIESVKKLCSRAIFINDNTIKLTGTAKKVCDEYERYVCEHNRSESKSNSRISFGQHGAESDENHELSYGNNKAIIDNCWIQNNDGAEINIVETAEQVTWCFNVVFNSGVIHPVYSMQLKTREGIALFGVDSEFLNYECFEVKAGTSINVRFDFITHLAPGDYFLNCGIRERNSSGAEEFLHRKIDAAILRVVTGTKTSAAVGLVDLDAGLSLSYS